MKKSRVRTIRKHFLLEREEKKIVSYPTEVKKDFFSLRAYVDKGLFQGNLIKKSCTISFYKGAFCTCLCDTGSVLNFLNFNVFPIGLIPGYVPISANKCQMQDVPGVFSRC